VIGGVLAVLLGVLMTLPTSVQVTNRWVPSAFGNLKQVSIAFYMYQDKNGCLPADPRGSSYALYLLKDLVEGHAEIFADPDGKGDIVPTPRFDDEQRLLLGSHFAYLNDPKPAADDVVVLAEVPGINPKGRYFLTLSGAIGRIDAETDPLANRPLLGLRSVDGKFWPTSGDGATSAESGTP
jgi:hypothetical protein